MELNEQRVELPTYLTLYTPALDWMLQSMAHQAPDSLLAEILTRCKDQRNRSVVINFNMYVPSTCTKFQTLYLMTWDTVGNMFDQSIVMDLEMQICGS